jgi:hypothetical protein
MPEKARIDQDSFYPVSSLLLALIYCPDCKRIMCEITSNNPINWIVAELSLLTHLASLPDHKPDLVFKQPNAPVIELHDLSFPLKPYYLQ